MTPTPSNAEVQAAPRMDSVDHKVAEWCAYTWLGGNREMKDYGITKVVNPRTRVAACYLDYATRIPALEAEVARYKKALTWLFYEENVFHGFKGVERDVWEYPESEDPTEDEKAKGTLEFVEDCMSVALSQHKPAQTMGGDK